MDVDVVAIGYGGIARPQLRYLDAQPGVTIRACADVDEEARSAFETSFDAPAYPTHEALLADHGDADLGTVITPHAYHHAQILACLDAGMHVYVEKPLVVDLDEAVEVIGAARERDCLLQVGYQRRFHPLFDRLRRIVDDGRIGQPHFAACHLEQDWIGPQSGTWRTEPAISGGGQLVDSGSHLLDVLLWCTGADPRKIAVRMDRRDGVDVNSALSISLDRDGRTLTASVGVTANGATYPKTGDRLFIAGTAGTVRYSPGELEVVERGEEPGDTSTSRITEDVDDSAVFVAKLDDVIGAVREARSPAVPGDRVLGVTALIEAAYEADEREAVVDVSQRLDEARASLGVDGPNDLRTN